MKEEYIVEVIDKLVGGITPIGETNCDNEVKENLTMMVEIVDHYIGEIYEVAKMNAHQASIQECQKIAERFVRSLRDVYESLDT